jgi:short-subunit dehydrogenase
LSSGEGAIAPAGLRKYVIMHQLTACRPGRASRRSSNRSMQSCIGRRLLHCGRNIRSFLASQEPGYQGPVIVCIGSVQGRFSIPYRSAYAASKHAFQAYFDCLRAELVAETPQNQSPIRVLMVTPGYIATNLSMNAVSGDGTRYGKLDETTKGGLTPENAAKEILKSVIECRKELIMSTLTGPWLVIALRPYLPWLYFSWTAKRAIKERNGK